jgi:hypothetical protein
MTGPTPPRHGPPLLRPLLLGLLGTLIVLGLVIVGVVSSGRALQVDEVEHVHAAYNVRRGQLPYEDFHQPHNPLLYYALWPVVDPEEPEESFRRSRLVTTAVLVLNVALCGICAGRLGGLPAAVLALCLSLSHTTFVERGLEVRTDGPMSALVVAALAVELSGMPRRKRYGLEALLLSGAFLLTNKACFACFAFGCLWLLEAVRTRRPALVAVPMAIWIVPLLVAFGLMAAAGNLAAFLDLNFGRAVGELARTTENSSEFSFSRTWVFVQGESARNLAFCVVALAGWLIGMASWRRGGGRVAGLRFTAYLAVVLFASLWLNPFPFPYLHVTILPVFVVLAGVAGARLIAWMGLEPHRPAAWAVVLFLAAAAAVQGMPFIAWRGVSFLEHQFATLREVQRVVEPQDAVFDMAGLYFRPDAHRFYFMTGHTLARYRLGEEVGGIPRIPDELRRNEAVAFIVNYRFDWLPPSEQWFLHNHFVHFEGNVFLIGSRLLLEPGETIDFEVLKGKTFRYDGEGSILVDGEPFSEGFLDKGTHRITRVERNGRDRLIMAVPSPRRWPPSPPSQLYEFF